MLVGFRVQKICPILDPFTNGQTTSLFLESAYLKCKSIFSHLNHLLVVCNNYVDHETIFLFYDSSTSSMYFFVRISYLCRCDWSRTRKNLQMRLQSDQKKSIVYRNMILSIYGQIFFIRLKFFICIDCCQHNVLKCKKQ